MVARPVTLQLVLLVTSVVVVSATYPVRNDVTVRYPTNNNQGSLKLTNYYGGITPWWNGLARDVLGRQFYYPVDGRRVYNLPDRRGLFYYYLLGPRLYVNQAFNSTSSTFTTTTTTTSTTTEFPRYFVLVRGGGRGQAAIPSYDYYY